MIFLAHKEIFSHIFAHIFNFRGHKYVHIQQYFLYQNPGFSCYIINRYMK
jgi:hypothetical protein